MTTSRLGLDKLDHRAMRLKHLRNGWPELGHPPWARLDQTTVTNLKGTA